MSKNETLGVQVTAYTASLKGLVDDSLLETSSAKSLHKTEPCLPLPLGKARARALATPE